MAWRCIRAGATNWSYSPRSAAGPRRARALAGALEYPMVGLKPSSTLHSWLSARRRRLGRSPPGRKCRWQLDAMRRSIAAGMAWASCRAPPCCPI